MATWSTSTWQNYGSDVNTGYDWGTLESVFGDAYNWIGTEWHGSAYRYRTSRILFTTPSGEAVQRLSFKSSELGYRPMWSGSSDNSNNHPSISWQITSADDKTCLTNTSGAHGTISIVEADPWGTGRKGYFQASEVILPFALQPNTQYALWLFPTGGVKNTYNGYNFADPDSGIPTITFTGAAATYWVTQYHFYEHVINGWTSFNTTTNYVTHGNSFTPYNVSAPTGYSAGNNYGYYNSDYVSMGNGTVGQNSFTVTQNMYVHVHYYPNNYSYNLNVLLPDGSEPYSTGTAGSVECSINGGAYSRIYNESASSYPYGSTFNFRNFTPGTGMYLSSVSGASGSGPWSATMGTGGLNINFQTAYNTYTNYIAHWKYVGTGGDNGDGTFKHMGTTSFTGTCASAVTIPTSHIQSYTGHHNDGIAGSSWGTSSWSSKTIGSTFTQPAGRVDIEYYYFPDTYTVSYNANGGSGAPSSQTKTYGKNLTLSSTKPTKASTVTYPTGTITISYAANGGSSTPSASTGTYTNQKTVPYSFSHWNTASNNSGTTYYSGGTYTANAGATLYAQYSTGSATETRYSNPSIKTAAAISRANGSVTGYKVSFNANSGSSTPSAITSTKTRKYTFAHWKNTSSGSTFSASANYTFSANATLTAQWSTSDTNNAITLPAAISRANASAGSYTVTFNANGGSCSTASLAAARTTKYTFGGWNTNSSGTGTNYSASGSYTPSAATTLYAKWSSSTSTAAITLPTPTRDGYTFKGWSTSSSATSGSTGSYTPTGNVTLYATWAGNTYYIYYKQGLSNGGTLPSTTSRTYPSAATVATNNMTKSATTANSYTVTYYKGNATGGTVPSKQTSINTTTYTKNGWTTGSSNTNDRDYANGASYGANSTSNLTLYPNFTTSTTNGGVTLSSNTMTKNNGTANGYTVVYATGTSTGGTIPKEQVATDTIAYTHSGWAKSQNGSKAYNKGAATGALSANLSLYPTFSSSVATRGSVTLATNSMTKSNTTDYSYTITYNYNYTGATNTTETVTKTRSYTANGWTTTSGSTSRTHANGASHQVTANITLYPCFTQSTTGGSTTLPTLARTGYTFNGWYSTASGGTKIGTGGASYTPTSNVTLYANWSPITYEVKYNGNGATSGSMSNSTHTYDVAKALTANAFTRAYTVTYNYNGNGSSNTSATATATFNGWATSASGSKVHNDKASVKNLRSSAGTYNLYAHWTLKSITLPTPTRTGYSLAGWYTAASGGTKVGAGGASYTPSANITLYAQWTENTYYVYYKNGLATGGTLPGTTSRKYTANATIATNSMSKSNTTASGYSVTYANGTATGGTLPSAQTATDTTSYTANGWTTGSSNTNDRDYANGKTYGANTTNNLTLYPNFTTSLSRGSVTLGTNSMTKSTTSNGSYTVTLNANGGSVSSTSLSAARSITYAANGWTKTSGSTTRNYANGASVQMTAALTLYPCFTQTNVTAAVTLPTPTRTGYTFKGWSTSSTATTGTTGSYTPTGNVTLYATWQVNSYKLTISAGTGSTITVSRTSSPNGGASTGTVSNNGTIYYGDVLKITFSISDDRYKIVTKKVNNSNFTSGNSHTVTGNVSVATTTDVYSYTIDSNKHYIYIYNGSSWDKYVAYIYNGSTWEVHGE